MLLLDVAYLEIPLQKVARDMPHFRLNLSTFQAVEVHARNVLLW